MPGTNYEYGAVQMSVVMAQMHLLQSRMNSLTQIRNL